MRTSTAETIIRNHVLFAAGGGLIPYPLMDIAAVTAIQLDMLQQLSDLYEVGWSRSSGKLRLSAIGGTMVARLGASLVKAIPGVGTVIGSLTMSGLSAVTTYAVGKVFVKHYESGGSLYDFDAEKYREMYEQELEEGKGKTEDWKEEADAQGANNSSEDAQLQKMNKLKELAKLKAEGVITEEEFKKMKKKILAQF